MVDERLRAIDEALSLLDTLRVRLVGDQAQAVALYSERAGALEAGIAAADALAGPELASNGAQHHALVQEAERRGLPVIRVFDVTASGLHGQQEREFSKLVEGLQRGRYTTVICSAIDRLTRQGVSETIQAVHRITGSGGTLVSLQEP